MIRFDNVGVQYRDATAPVLRDVDLTIDEGELVLVVGRTGSGKSTLLGTVNGPVPHFSGGHLSGVVSVDGVSTASRPPREFAHLVGVVGQDPSAGFVTDTVEEELAYAMEQQGVPADVMRKRVEETLDLLGIAELRGRPLGTLSGGQQQRVAIGSVLTSHPRVIVLDEPTSALDPTAAEEVLSAVTRLVHDLGVTVLMAEHRMERVVQYADRLIHVADDGTVRDGAPAALLADLEFVPPVVALGRVAGMDPLPLSVRDARRGVGELRSRLTGQVPAPRAATDPTTEPLLTSSGVTVRYGDRFAVRGVDLDLRAGEVMALMGRNGAGKSSLLWALQGSGPRQGGRVTVDGEDPQQLSSREARARVGLVPQTAADLLYLETVGAECAQADTESGAEPGACRALLDRLRPGIDPQAHPRDLSEGQRLCLVLAVQLVAAPRVMLLDEPTRGLDYTAKAAFGRIITDLAAGGHSIVVSTHDVEFVAAYAGRVVVMAEGEIVADGPTDAVINSSPAFAPQVAKILGLPGFLTVTDVIDALAEDRSPA